MLPNGRAELKRLTFTADAIRRACVLLIALLLLAGTAQAQPRSAGPASGSLLIVGGGVITAPLVEAAQRLAGGAQARWVVLPTAAAPNAHRPPEFILRSGARYAVLDTNDRTVADSEAFVAPLRTATAVWINGGRQWRLVDVYAGTRTEQALHEVLQHGGLIAGSSAGATIQGSFLVRGSPRSNTILMAPGHERGFGFLQNVAIDQHVIVRHRESDLAQVVAAHPGLLGIGIDESTAIVVQQNTMTVIGRDVVLITDGAEHSGKPYYTLTPGSRFDLATWSTLPAAK